MSSHNLLSKRAVPPVLSIVVACLALALLLTAQAHARPQDQDVPDAPGSLAGIVRNPGGMPLAGITVELYLENDANAQPQGRTLTSADGAYRFDVLGAGLYYVGFTDPAQIYATQFYAGQPKLVDATPVRVAGHDVTGIDATLGPGGVISGVVSVTDSLMNSDTYGQVTLYIDDGRDGRRFLDSTAIWDGFPYTYSFGGLAATRYYVCASAGDRNRFYRECYDNTTAADLAEPVDLAEGESRPAIDFLLGDGADSGVLGGVVTGAQGEPLAGITVMIAPPEEQSGHYDSGVTAIDGSFVITGVPPQAYTVAYEDPEGRYLSSFYDEDNAGQPLVVTLPPFGERTDLDQQLEPAAWITGVITLRDGAPATSGYVTAQLPNDAWYGLGTIAPSGHYTITGLEAGAYLIYASATHAGVEFGGYYGEATGVPQIVQVAAGEIVTGIDIELATGAFEGVLNGRVVHGDVPLPGIRVEVHDSSHDGIPGIPVPPPAAQSVRAGGGTHGVDEIDALVIYTNTDARGNYAIEGMLANEFYRVSFADPAGIYASRCNADDRRPYFCQHEYLNPISNTLTITGDLVIGGQVTGNVDLPPGERTDDHRVLAYFMTFDEIANYSTYDEAVVASIDPDGSYALPGLHPGQYRIALLRDDTSFYGGYTILQFYPFVKSIWEATTVNVEPQQTVPEINFRFDVTPRQWLPIVR